MTGISHAFPAEAVSCILSRCCVCLYGPALSLRTEKPSLLPMQRSLFIACNQRIRNIIPSTSRWAPFSPTIIHSIVKLARDYPPQLFPQPSAQRMKTMGIRNLRRHLPVRDWYLELFSRPSPPPRQPPKTLTDGRNTEQLQSGRAGDSIPMRYGSFEEITSCIVAWGRPPCVFFLLPFSIR